MSLTTPERFFDSVRASGLLGATLSQDEVDGCQELLRGLDGWPTSWVAYGLATAYHETAHTMKPIDEIGSDAYFNRRYGVEGLNPARAREMGNKKPGDGAKYHGRGYVQLTWYVNYLRAEKSLGVPFTKDPDLAKDPKHAATIMRRGMEEGWFTGKRIGDYISAQGAKNGAYKQARRVINGTDKDDEIAAIAVRFQDALMKGGWR